MPNSLVRSWRRCTASWRKQPDFIIIGAQKAGTTSLFYYLNQHPSLRLATRKEVHYYDLNYNRGSGWYRSFFPYQSCPARTGESSPYYFFHPLVPQRLQADNPNVQLILLLRDPVERAFSHYGHNRSRGIREPIARFEDALLAEPDRLAGEEEAIRRDPTCNRPAHQHFSYVARGRYAAQLGTWRQYFADEQFLVLQSEAFFADPREGLQRCYRFLGLDEAYPRDLKPQNTGRYRADLSNETRAMCEAYFAEDQACLRGMLAEMGQPAFCTEPVAPRL